MRPRQTANKKRSIKIEPINVEAEYERKYALQPDDLIVPIDAGTFRQAFREKRMKEEMERERDRSQSRSHGKEREREQERERDGTFKVDSQRRKSSSATVTAVSVVQLAPRSGFPSLGTSGGSGVGNSNNHTSLIGPAIQNMKAKRALGSAQQHFSETHSPKRRRVNPELTTITHTSNMLVPARTKPNIVPSNVHVNANAIAGPSHKRRIASTHSEAGDDDLMIISDRDDSPRKRSKAIQNMGEESPRVEMQGKRAHDVIELSSDGEIMEVSPPPQREPKRARTGGLDASHGLRQTPIELCSDESEPEAGGNWWGVDPHGHALAHSHPLHPTPLDESDEFDDDEGWELPGMDLNDTGRWEPMPEKHDVFVNDNLNNTLQRLDIAETLHEPMPAPIFYMPPDTTVFDPRTPPKEPYSESFESTFIWNNLTHCRNVFVPPRRRPEAYRPPNRIRPSARVWSEDFGMHRLTRAFHDPCGFNPITKAPGCVTRIEQRGAWTIVASSCVGGLADQPDEVPFNNNREGSLMTWNGELDIPVGHQLMKTQWQRIKHYAVHDIKFDPTRDVFVSSGADRRVRLWTLSDVDEEDSSEDGLPSKPRWTNRYFVRYDPGTGTSGPHELAFKPTTSIIAIAERKLKLYDISKRSPKELVNFTASQSRSHVFGAIVWGMQSTEDHLFAVTEPLVSIFEGFHKVYDVNKGSMLYQFDASEAGDTISLGPTGEIIALSTRGEGNRPILRLYDVARRNGTATSTTSLDEFPVRYPDFEGEVNWSVFSPDGILLALARNDNQTHVYDIRNLSRGPMHRYKHTGECKAAKKTDVYGAVKAQWVQSTRSQSIALITGGEDGCVRLWDPNKSEDNQRNGVVIAEVDSDIGNFSLGDPFAGEHRLVVGDCNGEFSIFDNVVPG